MQIVQKRNQIVQKYNILTIFATILMTKAFMSRFIFSLLPFFVCLNWLIIYSVGYRHADSAKRVHTWFLLAATVLYLCHAYYFLMGMSAVMEGLWILCSLSVYPLYFMYIFVLTSGEKLNLKLLCSLLPAVASAIVAWSGLLQAGQLMHKIIFAIQVCSVCYFGFKRLQQFDKDLENTYADTELYSTHTTRQLLVYFVLTSICSVIFNIIGKQYFSESDWLIIVPSLLFGTMLFALSYAGLNLKHVATQLNIELQDETTQEPLCPVDEPSDMPEDNKLGVTLDLLMKERKIYLQQDIKIGDLAHDAGTCRTYLSAYLNQELGLSFSDYINRHRIEYAKELMRMADSEKMWIVANKAGFSSEQSFYRNFRKFVGMNPAEWLAEEKKKM